MNFEFDLSVERRKPNSRAWAERQNRVISEIHLDVFGGINLLGGANRMPCGKIALIY